MIQACWLQTELRLLEASHLTEHARLQCGRLLLSRLDIVYPADLHIWMSSALAHVAQVWRHPQQQALQLQLHAPQSSQLRSDGHTFSGTTFGRSTEMILSFQAMSCTGEPSVM